MQEWKPAGFVLGLPLNMDGTEQWITHEARNFAQALQARYAIPIHPVDERLSTVEARQVLFDERGYRGLKKEAVDAMAATLLLQTWLENKDDGL